MGAQNHSQNQAAEGLSVHSGIFRGKTGGSAIPNLGPTGKLLLMEEVTEQELYQAFADQAQALAEGGADALCIETMSDLDEAC